MDALCYEDLDEFGRDLDDPLAELEQDIVHMLLESYGSNCDAPERGIGLEDALSGPPDPGLKHRIETKLTQDPRIDAVKATLTSTDDQTVLIELDVQADAGVLGVTFEFDAAGNVTKVNR